VSKRISKRNAPAKSDPETPEPARAPVATARRRAVDLPEELIAELAKNPEASAIFHELSPSHQKEYVRWVTEGKREPTRAKRAQKAIGMLLERRPKTKA
jgi:uncharacterized protein YdeI (YjbR/CyaY-like superfamily)